MTLNPKSGGNHYFSLKTRYKMKIGDKYMKNGKIYEVVKIHSGFHGLIVCLETCDANRDELFVKFVDISKWEKIQQ